ncbi:hypothetical protein [Heyndrickxia oleronia]|uniref:hypothetical protein n=1 Tax=Heyndrickxia oleronia TaxID=38875 RepID=UPI001C0EC9E1|nr:hypothetical protein [Heyndrickxia oleronia]MBU5214334.1 hypothetical protein [Heyndrickxia oleronia]
MWKVTTIPFHDFVSGAALPIAEGYIFFGGLSVVLLGVIVLEKLGITINDAMLKVMLFATFVGMVGWFIIKNPFIRHFVIGF